jgi:hypothetical protein
VVSESARLTSELRAGIAFRSHGSPHASNVPRSELSGPGQGPVATTAVAAPNRRCATNAVAKCAGIAEADAVANLAVAVTDVAYSVGSGQSGSETLETLALYTTYTTTGSRGQPHNQQHGSSCRPVIHANHMRNKAKSPRSRGRHRLHAQHTSTMAWARQSGQRSLP